MNEFEAYQRWLASASPEQIAALSALALSGFDCSARIVGKVTDAQGIERDVWEYRYDVRQGKRDEYFESAVAGTTP